MDDLKDYTQSYTLRDYLFDGDLANLDDSHRKNYTIADYLYLYDEILEEEL